VLAELARRDQLPKLWLPDPAVRGERERARFRLQLVHQRTALKNRVHATLIAHGHPCPVSDLFGTKGRQLLSRLAIPDPWQGTLQASLRLIDDLDREIDASSASCAACRAPLRALLRPSPASPGAGYDRPEIGASTLASPRKLTGYTGLCPRSTVGERDRRGPDKARPPLLAGR
jgi:hypothetical protein